MPYAVELFFDDRAEAAVRELWHRLTDASLPSLETLGHRRHRPHLTLTVVEAAHPPALADVGPLPLLRFLALGTFAGDGGVLFLAAVVTAPLLGAHTRVSDLLREQDLSPWPHYLPGTWVPHCTLAMNLTPAELSAAVGLLAGFREIEARVVEAGITDTGGGTP